MLLKMQHINRHIHICRRGNGTYSLHVHMWHQNKYTCVIISFRCQQDCSTCYFLRLSQFLYKSLRNRQLQRNYPTRKPVSLTFSKKEVVVLNVNGHIHTPRIGSFWSCLIQTFKTATENERTQPSFQVSERHSNVSSPAMCENPTYIPH